ncbi:MAG: 5-oxoprolinase subunit PxpB [Chloroflexota bacterium]
MGRPLIETRPFGDAALQVVLGRTADPATVARVHAFAASVTADRMAGTPWGPPVPGMTTVLVPFDQRAMDQGDAAMRLMGLAGAAADATASLGRAPRLHRIPVRYGGEHGPDLAVVAERLGLVPDQVVELHASVCYMVYIIGFMPGFAYLGDLPEGLMLPRRDTPRQRVPPGSVAIAGRHTAAHPASTPGGWHLIGWTAVRPWDIERDPPALLRPGDQVRFEPLG